MKIISVLPCFCLFLLGMASPLKADLNSDPWQINVYAISGIGNSGSSYSGASIAGIAASGGSSYLSSIGLDTSGQGATFSMYTGGNLTLNASSSNHGGLSVSGNLNYNNSSVSGNVSSGGNLTGNSGSITGNVSLGGTNQSGSGLSIIGTVSQNQAFTSPVNYTTVSNYFQQASTFWAGLPATSTWTNVYGQIVVSNLQAGRNIVNLALADISTAYGIKLTGPANAFVVFNVTDATGNLETVTYNFSGGVNMGDVLFNLPNSTSLSMAGGTYASVLAPSATVTYNNGMLQGNLVANNLLGSGSFSHGSAFTGFAADQAHFAVVAPEPSTYLMLATFIAAAIYLKRKKAPVV